MISKTLPMGCSGGVVGVAAPLTSWSADDVNQATYLGGSARAAVKLTPTPMQDASVYTPAAKLSGGADEVEDGHSALPAESGTNVLDAVALSSQTNWAADRLNPFGKLWDVLAPVREWLTALMPVTTLESGLIFAGAQASDLSVPVVMQMADVEQTSGQRTVTPSKPDKGSSSSQGDGQKSTPPQGKKYKSVPMWRLMLAKYGGARW